ncbi:MAG TPA: MarR family transcriptional regulator [Candidatus Limnocylindrales bacterium]|nr:MarR family transcriptional regulator [Candidatus Limnocylindrales bacterium]
MRTINPGPAAAAAAPASRAQLVDQIVERLSETVSGLRCAGTGKMVKLGISMTHLHILWLLDHHGDLPMSRLAELLDVSVSSATGLVDRMAERGLVERLGVPDDRRIVLIRVAPEGARVRDEVEALRQDSMRAILSRLDAAQLVRVKAALTDISGAVAETVGTDHLDIHTSRI